MIEWIRCACLLAFFMAVVVGIYFLSGGKRRLKERLRLLRERPGRTFGVLAVVGVVAAVMLTVIVEMPLIGRKDAGILTEASGEENAVSVPEHRKDVSPEESSPVPEQEIQPIEGTVFGYNDYTGYMDQCVQWTGYQSFSDCDYDGDGIVDRVWRENIQTWGVADYRIEFGNGDVIELPKAAGGIPEVRSLDLEGDGVREILFTEYFSYSTNPQAFGQMALFRKTEEGYEMEELPGGMSRADSDARDIDGTMLCYQPALSFSFEEAGGRKMRVTCPELEKAGETALLDVVVDFTQEAWEMGSYDKFYIDSDSYISVVPYWVDVISLPDGRDALQLRFGMLDKWCSDETIMTLEWKNDGLHIGDIRYWHRYVETAYAQIGGEQYELILQGAGYVGRDQYTIDTIQVVCFRYDERFKGMVEDQIQVILPEDAAKEYWGTEYVPENESGFNGAVSGSRNGNILVTDLDFDGNEDFCIQGWVAAGDNIPYYCYIWDEDTGQFGYGGCLFNVETDKALKRIRCSVDEGGGVYSTQYYRYENGKLLIERYVKEDTSSDAVFGRMDLTYVETGVSTDLWDYGEGGSDLFLLAERALAELYQMTGSKVEESFFTVSEFGDFYFALEEEELKEIRFYYGRCYGAQEGFTDCITSIVIPDEKDLFYAPNHSPVKQLIKPPDLNRMTDQEIVGWYFENSPFGKVDRWQFGNTTLKAEDRVDTIEEAFAGDYIIKTESGRYFELTYDKETKTVQTYFGPYESYPTH